MGNLGIISKLATVTMHAWSVFSYFMTDGPLPKRAFGLIAILKLAIWRSYQTPKNEKIPIKNRNRAFWLKNAELAKSCNLNVEHESKYIPLN